MTRSLASLHSTMHLSCVRYARSKGLWILLLAGLLGARFWVPRDDHISVIIAVNNQLPVITSAMIGFSLGIVLTTLLTPFVYIYLRTNINRRQPWQIIEVTAASRIALSFGHFFADSAILLSLLVVMTLAGWLVAFIALPFGQVHLWQIALPLWLCAAPAPLGLAPIPRLFASFSFTRRALGDVLFFVLWMTSLIMPVGRGVQNTFVNQIHDFTGCMQALGVIAGTMQSIRITIGSEPNVAGHILLQPLSVVLTSPYLVARLVWIIFAVVVVAFAGLVYRPHTARRQIAKPSRWSRLLGQTAPPPATHPVIAARASSNLLFGLVFSELRLIFQSRPTQLTCLLIALAGFFADYRHAVSPVIFLLLIFGITAQAAREESPGILSLTITMPTSPNLRRAIFIVAGTAGTVALSLPAILVQHNAATLLLAMKIGLSVSLFATAMTAITRSAFSARLLLLLAWYGYIST